MKERLDTLQTLEERARKLAAALAAYAEDAGLAASFSMLSDNVELFDTYRELLEISEELQDIPTFAFGYGANVMVRQSGVEGVVIAIGVFGESLGWMYRVRAKSNGAILGWFYAYYLEATDVD